MNVMTQTLATPARQAALKDINEMYALLMGRVMAGDQTALPCIARTLALQGQAEREFKASFVPLK